MAKTITSNAPVRCGILEKGAGWMPVAQTSSLSPVPLDRLVRGRFGVLAKDFNKSAGTRVAEALEICGIM
jgi:hypothetical protein